MPRLVISAAARADLIDIGDYIRVDNPARAFSFVEELQAKAERIFRNPLAYPARDEVVAGLRSASHGRYMLYYRNYRIVNDGVRIERVLHSARDHTSTLFAD